MGGPAAAEGPAGGGRVEAHTRRQGAPFPARRPRAPPPPAPSAPCPAERRQTRRATSSCQAASAVSARPGRPPGSARGGRGGTERAARASRRRGPSPGAAPHRPRRAPRACGQWGRGGCCSSPRGSVYVAPRCRPAPEAPSQVRVAPCIPSLSPPPAPQPGPPREWGGREEEGRCCSGTRWVPLTAPAATASPGSQTGARAEIGVSATHIQMGCPSHPRCGLS